MQANSEHKLVVFEDDSCMEVPESDGEVMPDVKYDFSTNKNLNAIDASELDVNKVGRSDVK